MILQPTGKRKRALPEGNSPGISCSTGMVKERKGKTNLSSYYPYHEQNALKKLIFILLIGPKKGELTLPNGENFELTDKKSGTYLYHCSGLGEYLLGSDAITHSYINHNRKTWLTQQIQDEVQELFDTGSTIGAYTLFPNNRVDKQHTINQARGVNSLIDDRFDLTLECIRLFYAGQQSPLYDTFKRYKNFFDLFGNFKGYIDFFLLNDLVDENKNIKFYLPFDYFKTKPTFPNVEEYLTYKKGVINFIKARNNRIDNYANQQMTEQNARH